MYRGFSSILYLIFMKILVVSKGREKFIQQDVKILAGLGHDVVLLNSSLNRTLLTGSFDLVISWFLSKHSIIPFILSKLYNKKIYCITAVSYTHLTLPTICSV